MRPFGPPLSGSLVVSSSHLSWQRGVFDRLLLNLAGIYTRSISLFRKRHTTTTTTLMMKMTMMMIQALLTSVLAPALVRAEIWRLHGLYANGDAPYFENNQGHRFTQLETGNLASINQTAETCSTTASRIICDVASVVSASDETAVNLDLRVECDLDSQIAADFRRAANCACGVAVTDVATGEAKNCQCQVCPFGFGDSPVSIECADDFVIGECTSLDCGFACNGTCRFDCANSGPECAFCEDDVFAPTVAPTGIDDRTGTRRPSLVSSGADPTNNLLIQAVLGAVVGMALYVTV